MPRITIASPMPSIHRTTPGVVPALALSAETLIGLLSSCRMISLRLSPDGSAYLVECPFLCKIGRRRWVAYKLKTTGVTFTTQAPLAGSSAVDNFNRDGAPPTEHRQYWTIIALLVICLWNACSSPSGTCFDPAFEQLKHHGAKELFASSSCCP